MTSDDLNRELDKVSDVLAWADQYLSRENESNAALHCNERVLYSPLTVAVANARESLQRVRDHLGGET